MVDNLATGSVVIWTYPTDVANSFKVIVSKGSSVGWGLHRRGPAGKTLRFYMGRGTTDLTVNSTAVMVANAWQCVAATWSVAGNTASIYRGTLSAAAVDVSTSLVGGSGTQDDDSGVSLVIGNDTTPSYAWPGRIAILGLFDRVLTLAEIQQWQLDPTPLMTGCVGFWQLGVAGSGTATQPDLSGNGNTGTPTGTSLAAHVPVPTSRETNPLAALQRAGSW